FAHRAGHRTAAGPGADVGLGIQISPRQRRARHPRQTLERRRPKNVGRIHGRTARDPSRRESAAKGGAERGRGIGEGVWGGGGGEGKKVAGGGKGALCAVPPAT